MHQSCSSDNSSQLCPSEIDVLAHLCNMPAIFLTTGKILLSVLVVLWNPQNIYNVLPMTITGPITVKFLVEKNISLKYSANTADHKLLFHTIVLYFITNYLKLFKVMHLPIFFT